MLWRVIKYQMLIYALIAAGAAAIFAPVDIYPVPELKSGDVLLQTSMKRPGLVFNLLSRDVHNHAGILIFHKGRRFVLEAGDKVDFVPYTKWIAAGAGGRFTVLRHERLVPSDIQSMMQAVKPYFRQPYDTWIQRDNGLLYNSELVYVLFKSVGLRAGRMSTIRDLVGESMLTRSVAERIQPIYPGCEALGAAECEKVLLDQKLVTPASLKETPTMKRIYSNYLGGLL